jgi:hypothetical protein
LATEAGHDLEALERLRDGRRQNRPGGTRKSRATLCEERAQRAGRRIMGAVPRARSGSLAGGRAYRAIDPVIMLGEARDRLVLDMDERDYALLCEEGHGGGQQHRPPETAAS